MFKRTASPAFKFEYPLGRRKESILYPGQVMRISGIWFIVYRSAKHSKPGHGLKICLWWSFYISFPLFVYDFIYCGFYLGHSVGFLSKYWYITVYYILPWLIFPITGLLVDKGRVSISNPKEVSNIHQ